MHHRLPLLSAVLLLAAIALAFPSSINARPISFYMLAETGQSCTMACFQQGMNCNPHIVTDNSSSIFAVVNASCLEPPSSNSSYSLWQADSQPSVVTNPKLDTYGWCLGYQNVPGGSICFGSDPNVARVCRCDAPDPDQLAFGVGISNVGAPSDGQEHFVFAHVLSDDGDTGVMTHFWTTSVPDLSNVMTVRYYVDGEESGASTPGNKHKGGVGASIEFAPYLAAGVGFNDETAPWGNEWIGKGSAHGGWFWSFRVPFSKSIVVSVQLAPGTQGQIYVTVRGGLNVPITVGGRVLPDSTRLVQTTVNATYQPLEFVPLGQVSSGPGLDCVHFMNALSVTSGTMHFLEGCFRVYTPQYPEFPGLILGTGTEDYFDSAYYFDAGEFHLATTGLTHMVRDTGNVSFSAYRFHDVDPIYFLDGYSFVWRVGEYLGASLIKCNVDEPLPGDQIIGQPTPSFVFSYSWAYVWDESEDTVPPLRKRSASRPGKA